MALYGLCILLNFDLFEKREMKNHKEKFLGYGKSSF